MLVHDYLTILPDLTLLDCRCDVVRGSVEEFEILAKSVGQSVAVISSNRIELLIEIFFLGACPVSVVHCYRCRSRRQMDYPR